VYITTPPHEQFRAIRDHSETVTKPILPFYEIHFKVDIAGSITARTGTLVKCVLVFFSIRIQWILSLWILPACRVDPWLLHKSL
jgi:hypothetical protein